MQNIYKHFSIIEIRTYDTETEKLLPKITDDVLTILNSIEQGIVIIGLDKNLLYLNDYTLHLTNHSKKEDLLGMPCYLSICTREKNGCPMIDQKKEHHTAECQLVARDKLRVEIIKTTTFVEYRGKKAILEFFFDITKQKTIERELASKNRFISSVFESLPHSFHIIDVKSAQVLMANKIAMGNFKEIHPGMTCFQLTHNRDEPCVDSDHQCPLNLVKETKKSVITRHTHYWHDGEAREYEVHGSPILNENGEVAQMIEYSIDITDRILAQKEKELLQKQVFQASKMASLSTLAAGIAHELNNPLTGIMGFAQIIQMQAKENEKLKTDAEKIITSALRMKTIIDQLSRFCSRADDYCLVKMDVTRVIKDSLILLNKLLVNKNIVLELKLMDNEFLILVDAMKLENVFHNLILNSKDAFESSGKIDDKKIIISTQNIGDNLLITYEDNAGGIPENIIGMVFDPFFTTKGVGGGVGIGLTIVHEIIKNHNGEISVSVDRSRGATIFKILIPKAK